VGVVKTSANRCNPRWDEHLVPLLTAMKARSLVAPNELFQAPLQYQLDLRHVTTFEQIYKPADLPNLRIIRLRDVGSSGETPQVESS